MKYRFLPIALLGILAFHVSAADDVAGKYPLLEQLTIPEEALPAGCKILDFPPGETPVKGLKNRAVSTDPKAFVLGDERFSKLIEPEAVEAYYLALYKEKNELGIFAWACKTEDAAKALHKKLTESYATEPERTKFWQSKNTVVMLWRDPGTTNECFQLFEKFIQDKIAVGKPQP